MSRDLVLRPSCSSCGSSSDLYGSNCKHMTLCFSCGKSMAQKKAKCSDCGATLTRLIREYCVRVNNDDDKNYFIGRFPTATGLPTFSRVKKNSENEWSLCNKEIQDGLEDKPWVLEDETGQSQYQGHLEQPSAAYYLLMQQGKEISAVPAANWFNFDKVAQYDKQLTLEEAEEKMFSWNKSQDAYRRWLMKAATNGAVAFGKVDKFGGKDSKNKTVFDDEDDDDDDESNISDKGGEDEEEEGARKNGLGLERRGGDDEVVSRDDDSVNDDSEKGDDWEIEVIFSDDENNPEDTEHFAPKVPIPPELKQFFKDDEEDDNNEEEGGLSEYGKELKKLLGRLNESDTESDDEDDDVGYLLGRLNLSDTEEDYDDENEDNQDQKPAVKEEPASARPVTEEEIRAVVRQQSGSAIYIEELIDHFPGRLELDEEKDALIEILKGMYSERLCIRNRQTMNPIMILY